MPAVITPVRAARSAPSNATLTHPASGQSNPPQARLRPSAHAKPIPARPGGAPPTPRLTQSTQSTSPTVPIQPDPAFNRASHGRVATCAPNAATPRASVSARTPASTLKSERSSDKPDHPILFQQYFKSVGPRTYALQVKKATNDNHYLVLTEGRRDKQSGEVRKMRINLFSEDFDAFFDLLRQAEAFIKAHPLSPEFMKKRKQFWSNIARRSKKSPSRSESPRPCASGGTR